MMAIVATRASGGRVPTAGAGRRDWRSIVFRGVAILVALLVLLGFGVAANLVAPWALIPANSHGQTPELHRWHSADIAAYLALIVCGSLIALVRAPRQGAVLAQAAVAGTGILALFCLRPLHVDVIVPCLVIMGLLVASFPAPRQLVAWRGAAGASRPLLALAIVAAVPLAVNLITNLRLQYTDGSEHAHANHWNGSAAFALTLILAGFLVASRRPGARALGGILALAYAYCGVAAFALAAYDGSWGLGGGALSLLAAGAYLAATLRWERVVGAATAAR